MGWGWEVWRTTWAIHETVNPNNIWNRYYIYIIYYGRYLHACTHVPRDSKGQGEDKQTPTSTAETGGLWTLLTNNSLDDGILVSSGVPNIPGFAIKHQFVVSQLRRCVWFGRPVSEVSRLIRSGVWHSSAFCRLLRALGCLRGQDASALPKVLKALPRRSFAFKPGLSSKKHIPNCTNATMLCFTEPALSPSWTG